MFKQVLEKIKFNLNTFLVWYFVILELFISYWILFFEQDPYFYFYYCYHCIFFIILLFVLKLKKFLPAIILSGFVGQCLFLFDFVVSMTIQKPFLNYYNYYLDTSVLARVVVFLAHTTAPLLFVLYVKKYKATITNFILSCLYFSISYLFAKYLIPLEYNIQGLYTTYTSLDNLPYYQDLFIVYAIVIYIAPSFFIYKFVHKMLNKKST
ncbi:hypothetical protein PK35_10495 [Tamlana nanhaiensis]|uniref:Uncharacterized protein n=1 Tax=Neotamlana nanhaiensis TaxID=1382798 RepID=A0A0D7W0Q4_9FLAO|nr:hypothetical protein [Tamlana nanhaiensis]KJD32619.1 hypothetical protein PK35_10495 [Tamlana nanhaiensis]